MRLWFGSGLNKARSSSYRVAALSRHARASSTAEKSGRTRELAIYKDEYLSSHPGDRGGGGGTDLKQAFKTLENLLNVAPKG
ncbi:hypothetical protein PssB301D_03639 [Pseudomonas syringae pv. syringae str. B301D-R]|nr:hypothetical protein PsyrB_07480 [Pseudomonas syringae pv. syringae B301D]EXL30412.1 hypothetical protein PssB301D_03639 [Pseudomonas syringae pv. syringae str. B301D-R]